MRIIEKCKMNKVARFAALGIALLMIFCVLFAGIRENTFAAYADLGGDDIGNMGDPYEIWLDVVHSEVGFELVKGIDPGLANELLTLPLWHNTRGNLLIKINYRVSNDLPFSIVKGAFKADIDINNGLLYTALKFGKKTDYPEAYKDGDVLSYLTTIEENAFQRCAFKVADMSNLDMLTTIGEYAFNECASLTTVDLSASAIKSIGDFAFANCGELYSINLDDCSNVSLGSNAFENCVKLTALDLKTSGVKTIGDRAFGACLGLKQIDFKGAPVTSIGKEAFYNTGLETLDLTGLPSLTEIKARAFGNCQSLKSVRMGYVPNVSADIFSLCNNLETIVFDSKETYDLYLDEGVFSALTAQLTYDGYAPRNDLEPWEITLIIIAAAVLVFAVCAAVYLYLRNKNMSKSKKSQARLVVETENSSAAALNYESLAATAAYNKTGAAASLPSTLTTREREVALLMLEGKKRKDIVASLFISDNTVKTHIANVLSKTGCQDQIDFIIKYNGKK